MKRSCGLAVNRKSLHLSFGEVRDELVALAILSPVIWWRLCCSVGQDGILRADW